MNGKLIKIVNLEKVATAETLIDQIDDEKESPLCEDPPLKDMVVKLIAKFGKTHASIILCHGFPNILTNKSS